MHGQTLQTCKLSTPCCNISVAQVSRLVWNLGGHGIFSSRILFYSTVVRHHPQVHTRLSHMCLGKFWKISKLKLKLPFAVRMVTSMFSILRRRSPPPENPICPIFIGPCQLLSNVSSMASRRTMSMDGCFFPRTPLLAISDDQCCHCWAAATTGLRPAGGAPCKRQLGCKRLLPRTASTVYRFPSEWPHSHSRDQTSGGMVQTRSWRPVAAERPTALPTSGVPISSPGTRERRAAHAASAAKPGGRNCGSVCRSPRSPTWQVSSGWHALRTNMHKWSVRMSPRSTRPPRSLSPCRGRS